MAALFAESAIARIERAIPRLMVEAGVPGLSIALVEDAALVWRGAFGVKERDASPAQPLDDRTVFEAASLSKPVFAYAALKLCEDGLLDLDTPLARYLPAPYSAYGLDPGEPRLQRVTARHVLSHSSGMGNWEDANSGRFSFAPGERFLYSGEGYMYLQRVVEGLAGRPLGPYMRERVLDPFGMVDSSYTWRDRYERQAASGHGDRDRDGGAGTRWPEAYAAYSLYSTPTDYARVLVELMRTDPGEADRLNRETLDRMLTPRTPIDDTLSWGLGWGLLRVDRGDYFWHWGDMRDYQHFTIASRARRHGLVIMTNSEHGLPVCSDITAALMGPRFAYPLDTVLRLAW